MPSLRRIAAAIMLLLASSPVLPCTASSAFAQDTQAADQQPAAAKPGSEVAAVTHVDQPLCEADTQTQLDTRRKSAAPAPTVIDAGRGYRLSQWPALPDTADDTDAPAAFLLLEKDGQCQLLVSGQQVNVTSLRLPLGEETAPQLVISSYSGGAHCCFSYDIVSLGDHFADDVIDSADSPISLMGLGDGDTPDITYADMAFAYWNTSFAESPAGQVRLTWDKDRYRLIDPKDQPAPGDAVIAAWQAEMTAAIRALPTPYVSIADQNNGKEGPQLDPVIWSHLLDLIYAGYPELAVDLYNKAWPDGIKGKDVFWKDFVTQLRQASVLWKPWKLGDVLQPDLPKAPG
ncbi:MAG TPA: hypothetical protein VM639_04725 [Dongiaceae bacterium]|nr:hypothetical protein [Dongiaceae bacterium]